MSDLKPDAKLNAQIYQESCEWLITFRTVVPDAIAREQLDAWLRKSPEHVRAYLEVSATWEDTALHDPLRTVSAEAHIARARTEDNVVTWQRLAGTNGPSDPPPTQVATATITTKNDSRHGRPRWRRLVLPTALAASVLLAAAGLFAWLQTRGVTYSTEVGEQRSITLSDGSLIELNDSSRISVHLSKRERKVHLLQGQALFQVAPDKGRPFLVRSADTIVRAVGTQFDMYCKETGTTVTVLEGRVAVSGFRPEIEKTARFISPSSDEAAEGIAPHRGEILLAAGEQVTVTPSAAARPHQANLSTATAWTQRRLVFDSAPLKEVVRDFNRYNRRQLVITSPGLENLAIVGVFSSTDPQPLLRFLSAQPGITLVLGEREVKIAQK